jgi:hypothetical protein
VSIFVCWDNYSKGIYGLEGTTHLFNSASRNDKFTDATPPLGEYVPKKKKQKKKDAPQR